jgi:hypothetical protein
MNLLRPLFFSLAHSLLYYRSLERKISRLTLKLSRRNPAGINCRPRAQGLS